MKQKKLFKYYEDGGWNYRMDMQIRANDIEEALELVWDYYGNSKFFNRDCIVKEDLKKYITEITELKNNDSKIISDESWIMDLS